MKLNDVVAESGHYFKVINSYSFPHEDQLFTLTCSFSHLLHFEEWVLGHEEGSEMQKEVKIFIITFLRYLRFFDLLTLNSIVVLLPEFKNKIESLFFIETTHNTIWKQITKGRFISKALPYEDKTLSFFLISFDNFFIFLRLNLMSIIPTVALIFDFFRQLQMHIVKVDPSWMFIIVNRRNG